MLKYYLFDAFTNRAFGGNPGVFIYDEDAKLSENQMQTLAKEFNLSETAFVTGTEKSGFRIRWFTPGSEVDLCGHATLGSAYTMKQIGLVKEDSLEFASNSGPLKIAFEKKGDDFKVVLDFPALNSEPSAQPELLEEALGVKVEEFFMSRFDGIAKVRDFQTLTNIEPNHELIKKLSLRGLIVTTNEGIPENKYDFASRFFCPIIGVPEDPVTGSAHCALATYWKDKLGKHSFYALQASHRPGELGVELIGDRVKLVGDGVLVGKGEISVP